MAQEREARRQERHSRDQLHASQMPCDEQHDGELMANELDPASINLECVESKTEQESTENDNPQVVSSEVIATAVQNKDQDQPIEFESRLQDRIERMMKGRNRSERSRIKKQVKAMRMEMVATV
jgi:hypothetical protein